MLLMDNLCSRFRRIIGLAHASHVARSKAGRVCKVTAKVSLNHSLSWTLTVSATDMVTDDHCHGRRHSLSVAI